LKIHLAVDVKSKQILALEAMDESIKECEMLKPLIEKAKKWLNMVKEMILKVSLYNIFISLNPMA
jgi:hypothetical protein